MIKLNDNEKVLVEVTKHWILLVFLSIYLIFLFLLPIIAYSMFSYFVDFSDFIPGDYIMLFLALYCLWIVFLWLYAYIFWTDLILDIWIFTDERLIAVDQDGFFRRKVSVLPYRRIQDINSDVTGIFETVFDYGDLRVQTAGSFVGFEIRNVKDINNIREKCDEIVKNYKSKHPDII